MLVREQEPVVTLPESLTPEQLWAQDAPLLVGWTQALVGDVEVARDIAAEAFARLILKWRSVEHPRAYLYVVAGNQVRDHWRRQERDRGLLARLTRGRPAEDSVPASDPWLRDLVERLPERTRTPVLLHYFADLPVAAVADVLGKPQSTVTSALADGRVALLAKIEDSHEH